MKKLFTSVIFFAASLLLTASQDIVKFNDYFIDATMRIDYFHVGNAEEELITVDRIYRQGTWAGSLRKLRDPFINGRYCIKVADEKAGRLLFSRGFDSYFGEYKTTDPALEGKKRTYHESALIPFPRKPVIFSIQIRNRENVLENLFSCRIDPDSVDILRENPESGVKVIPIVKNGDPHNKVDIAMVAEGYRLEDEAKLKADLRKFTKIFFSQEPYRSRKSDFNVSGVFRPSDDSGCDEPRSGIFKRTSLNATFNSLGLDRYLLTEDNKSLRDIAAHIPYDALVVLVNHKRYGGGGIYNLYCTFTTDNQWSDYLLLHEFGHSFSGLGDEYYTSSVAYNDFYPRGVEPTEPNITALLLPDRLKWKDLADLKTPIPTPWEKAEYDRMNEAYQKKRQDLNQKIASLKRAGARAEDILQLEKESEALSRKNAEKMADYLKNSRFRNIVGAFEGAGYSSEGLYRPMLDCIMFTKGKKPFCAVCSRSVSRIIDYYVH